MEGTTDSESRKLAEEISREVIAETAPEEITMFDQLVEEYYRDPALPAPGSHASDDPLGFGLDSGLLTLSTPIVMSIATQVVTYFKDEVIKSTREEAAASIRQKIKALLHAAAKDAPETPMTADASPSAQEHAPTAQSVGGHELGFSREQLSMIRKIVRNEAKKHGLSEEEAAKLANALIGRLALS
jgi:hypothetical protein